MNLIKAFAAAAVTAVTLVSLVSCGRGDMRRLDFVSPLSADDQVYYVGQEFDTVRDTREGKFYMIPAVYVVYSNGLRSEDVSHSENIRFSGYDPSRTGEQTIKVKYTENGHSITGKYKIAVAARTVARIEAEDNLHLYADPFKVGDRFVTCSERDNGDPFGVTVWLYYNDPNSEKEGFFTVDEEIADAVFDTSGCLLDEDGRFTEAGEFEVKILFCGCETSYKIRVE